jgi:hypothetical protein
MSLIYGFVSAIGEIYSHLFFVRLFNLLKPSGNFTYDQV